MQNFGQNWFREALCGMPEPCGFIDVILCTDSVWMCLSKMCTHLLHFCIGGKGSCSVLVRFIKLFRTGAIE